MVCKIRIGGEAIRNRKYADDLVLLAKEETVLQGMIDELKLDDDMEWKWMWKKN